MQSAIKKSVMQCIAAGLENEEKRVWSLESVFIMKSFVKICSRASTRLYFEARKFWHSFCLCLLSLFLITMNMKIDFLVDLRKVCVFGKWKHDDWRRQCICKYIHEKQGKIILPGKVLLSRMVIRIFIPPRLPSRVLHFLCVHDTTPLTKFCVALLRLVQAAKNGEKRFTVSKSQVTNWASRQARQKEVGYLFIGFEHFRT